MGLDDKLTPSGEAAYRAVVCTNLMLQDPLSFKNGFTGLGSRGQHGGMTGPKAFSSVSDRRLMSDVSIFEGIDAESKGVGFFTHMDDDAPSASTHNVATMPVISRVPNFPSRPRRSPTQLVSQTSLRADLTLLIHTARRCLISTSRRTYDPPL
jgi:hypothetical protein